jgi:hypothetical protein
MAANGGDETSERIRIAAESAAEAAEERAVEEILALERDVERAREEAESLRERVAEAEQRAAELVVGEIARDRGLVVLNSFVLEADAVMDPCRLHRHLCVVGQLPPELEQQLASALQLAALAELDRPREPLVPRRRHPAIMPANVISPARERVQVA